MSAFWVDGHGALQGLGSSLIAEPGIGNDRYHAALEGLRSSGRDRAFASFTFDTEEPDSLIDIPDRVIRVDAPPRAGELGHSRVVDDGIAEWRVGFEKAMLEIETGRVEKVVLARQMLVEFEQPPDPMAIVSRLSTANPGCYVFSVGGLIGASPELLVSLRRGRIRTLALAGTATDPGELNSVKIYEEHRHVASSVTTALEHHITEVDLTETVIVPHGAMSHVGTRIQGPARPGTTVADVLADLHPTAAVAGSPRSAALDLIREIEPGSRGRYAGPVGWMDSDGDGVFSIALRCGQMEGERMRLYSGGGLVAGSEEEAELSETDLKLAPMLRALRQE